MGSFLSRILGSKVTLRERLEKVDKDLRNIQRFQVATEVSQKRWIGRLVIASSVVYIISAVTFYFFGPQRTSWKTTVMYLVPFVIFPFLIWGLKRLMAWHYKRKIGDNVDRAKELKAERQRLLEDVMEFETFNNAKEILEKYDPNRLLPKYLAEQKLNSPASSPVSLSSRIGGGEMEDSLRRRNLPASSLYQGQPGSASFQTPPMRPIVGGQNQFLRQTMNVPFLPRPAIMPSPASNFQPQQQPPRQQYMSQAPRPMYMMPQPPGNPTLHNRRTGWLDKLVDYVVGDGPAHRYALICKYCATHNGLATPEDFPYTGYRCVFCRQYNPPRQVKPAAEKLPDNTVLIEEMESGSEINSPRSMASSISPGRDAGASETLEKEVATESQDDGNSEDSVTPNSDKLNEPSGIESVTTDAAETDSHKSETVERQPEALSVEPEEGTNTGTSAEKVESSSSAFEPFELMDTENETGSSLPLPTKGSESSESNLESLIEAAADLQIG